MICSGDNKKKIKIKTSSVNEQARWMASYG